MGIGFLYYLLVFEDLSIKTTMLLDEEMLEHAASGYVIIIGIAEDNAFELVFGENAFELVFGEDDEYSYTYKLIESAEE